MKVVLDSNVLFRMLISQGSILTLLADERLELLAPETLKEEFAANKEEILSKSGLSISEFERFSSKLFSIITVVPYEEYEPFIREAKKLVGSHAKDEDFIALCLAKGAKLWTYESFLFKLGFGISTKEISERLE